ncbi:MAG: squalene/phytoene synthase family protein [Actinomycetota bacterium]|nr:squalene/phytoene synthase family protein [Actinomycetota bacterium]
MNVTEAYARCEAVTRTEAKNFSYGIRLLPPAKRQAMSALYAVARRIDDIGDGVDPGPVKLDALAEIRTQLAAIVADPMAAGDDPILVALADASARYPIPMTALEELIDGCEMDVNGTTYRTFDDLVVYCRRVAGTVGRLSLGVYGCDDPVAAEPLADALGVALQITNILRDVVEDRDTMGRVYLPRADLARFGAGDDLRGPVDNVAAVIAFEAARAETWYAEGLRLLPLLDRRSRACTAAMAGIYRRLLVRIQRQPAAVLHTRVSLPAWEKAQVALLGLTRGRS